MLYLVELRTGGGYFFFIIIFMCIQKLLVLYGSLNLFYLLPANNFELVEGALAFCCLFSFLNVCGP